MYSVLPLSYFNSLFLLLNFFTSKDDISHSRWSSSAVVFRYSFSAFQLYTSPPEMYDSYKMLQSFYKTLTIGIYDENNMSNAKYM